MNTTARFAAGLALALGMAGCVQAPTGPTVSVTPGPNKSAEEFQADQSACMTQAQQETAGARQGFNSAQIANMLNGGTPDPTTTGAAQASVQQQYDADYSQCMAVRGNLVPGFQTAGYDQGIGPNGAVVRAIQHQLRRLGYLRGPVDGVYGPATQNAVMTYQRANGLAPDGMPSEDLLASLRNTPGPAHARWRAPASSAAAEPEGKSAGWVSPPSSGASTGVTPAAEPAGGQKWVAPAANPPATTN